MMMFGRVQSIQDMVSADAKRTFAALFHRIIYMFFLRVWRLAKLGLEAIKSSIQLLMFLNDCSVCFLLMENVKKSLLN